jgi:hypothetical protein
MSVALDRLQRHAWWRALLAWFSVTPFALAGVASRATANNRGVPSITLDIDKRIADMDSPRPMAEAFKESAARHWHDARLLEKAKRHDNANQLVGFAAECAIKHALCQIPAFSKNGQLEGYRLHINELWAKNLNLQIVRRRFAELAELLKRSNPFHDWSVDHRYAKDGTVPDEASLRHRMMTARLLKSIGITGTRAGS